MTSGDLRFLDPTDSRARHAWDDVVKNSPKGSVFHTTAWMDVIRNGLGLAPRFAYLQGPHGSVRALVPLFCAGGWVRSLRWLNLPQSCSADPLAFEEGDEERLLEQLAFAAVAQDVTAVTLRTPRRFQPNLPPDWEVQRDNEMFRHVIDLRGANDIRKLRDIQWKQRQAFASSMRRLETQDMVVRMVKRPNAEVFTRVMHAVLLRKHGHLGMPVRFIEALLDFLPDTARLILAGPRDGRTSAFLICLWSRDCSSALYGSGLPTTEGADAYRVCIGTEINAAIRANLSIFDLSETSPDNEGLISFKERLGGRRVDGSYLIIARRGVQSRLRHVTGKRFAIIQNLFRYVPLEVSLKIAGPVHRMLQ